MKKEEKNDKVAPGMDDQEELDKNATKEEIKNGDYTHVTKLSYDEVGPSGGRNG